MRRERQEYLKQQSLKQRQLAIAAAKALADGVVHERVVNMFCFVGFSFGPFIHYQNLSKGNKSILVN
jgi:hypothetical protein